MTRLTKFLSSINWKRALGEFFLISVGVFFALAASDWQNRREDRQTEIAILHEIRSALTDDLASLELGLQRYQRIEDRTRLLLEHLRGARSYDESLDGLFGTAYEFNVFELNTAGYESLKSMGLELISNDELRLQLTRVYELDYPSAVSAMGIERDVVLDLLRPYFLEHFRDLIFGVSATPIHYDELVDDIEFINVIDYRLQVVLQNNNPAFAQSIRKIEELLVTIESDIRE